MTAHPDAAQLLERSAPGFAAGAARSAAWTARRKFGGLSRPEKALLGVLVCVSLHDEAGARERIPAAVASGVTPTQLLEGLLQIALVEGMSSWRTISAAVFAEFLEQSGAPAADQPADFRFLIATQGPDGSRAEVNEFPLPTPWPAKSLPRYLVWGAEGGLTTATQDPIRPAFEGIFPPADGVRVLRNLFAPGHGVAADTEQRQDPGSGIANAQVSMRSDGVFGMHSTDSVDFGVILRGRLTLVADNGVSAELSAGDCFILTGSDHRWMNQGTEIAELFSVMLGAPRAP